MALGVDGGREGFRVYAEPQLGWVLAGLSLGPVLEVSSLGAPARWGIQGSGWINAVGGLDMRYRYVDGRHTQARWTRSSQGWSPAKAFLPVAASSSDVGGPSPEIHFWDFSASAASR